MVLQRKVKCLFDSAMEGIFQGLIRKLEKLILESGKDSTKQESQLPKEKKRKLDSNDSMVEDSIEAIRAELNEYLASWYTYARPKLLQRFITYHSKKENTLENQEIFLSFMDSVLDHTFTKFTLLSKKCETSLIDVLKILYSRSPLLQTIELFMTSHQEAVIDSTFCNLLGKFSHLSSLTLYFAKEQQQSLDLFICLGQSFPQLEILYLDNIDLTSYKALALILGHKLTLLPSEFPIKARQLDDIQFTAGSLSPICTSLKLLEFENSCSERLCHCPSVTFLLRHFIKLEKLNFICDKANNQLENVSARTWMNASLLHLHKKQYARNSSRQKQINTSKRNSDELGLIEWTVQSPFYGNKYFAVSHNSK